MKPTSERIYGLLTINFLAGQLLGSDGVVYIGDVWGKNIRHEILEFFFQILNLNPIATHCVPAHFSCKQNR